MMPPVDPVEHINVALKRRGVSHDFKHRMSAAGRCVRARYYHGHGIEPTNEAEWRSLLAMARGQDIEDMAIALLKEGGAPIHGEQIELVIKYNDMKITGHPDGLWGEDGGIDIKGTNSSGWGWIKNNGAHDAYIDQCQMYMHSTGRKWWIILYVNRDGYPRDEFPFMPFIVFYDEDLFKQAIERYCEVEGALQAGKAPPRPYARPKEFPCSFCAWADHCWGEYVESYSNRESDEVELDNKKVELLGIEHEDLKRQIKDLEARLKPVRDEIGKVMEKEGLKKARAGKVKLSMWTQNRPTRNWDLLPEETLNAITETVTVEQLRVKVDDSV